MDKKGVNKAKRNAIKLGDINEVKRLIGGNFEHNDFIWCVVTGSCQERTS